MDMKAQPDLWACTRTKPERENRKPMDAYRCRRAAYPALGVIILGLCAATSAKDSGSALTSDSASTTIQFNRDIRPILSERCYSCHGPDKATRKTKMRFDTEEGAFTPLAGGGFAIVRGDPSKSAMLQRITSDNQAVRMPPAYMGYAKLPEHEIKLIRRWIEEGAPWQKHWSFIPPVRPPLPFVRNKSWPKIPLDNFVLARLEHEGLGPSAEADKLTLIRRVTLDLTGLPPTPSEVDAFLNDNSPGAYEKVVDRLLASSRYGEHMAWQWLEAARYADTNGYQSDGVRSMWRWRDWVIDAFNRNMPFDRFTVEQLAGDMLPHATRDQIIATGFNRNHRTSAEGGIIDEEFRVAYVVDRVDTTSTVWLGLTIGCARCHDHKFDPILQKEYYQLFAYFNNVPEKGFVYDYGNEQPYIKAPTPPQEAKLKEFDQRIAAAEQEYERLKPEIAKSQRAWERWIRNSDAPDWSIQEGLVLHFPLNGSLKEETGVYDRMASFDHQPDGDQHRSKPATDEIQQPVVTLTPSQGSQTPLPPSTSGSSGATLPFVPGKIGLAAKFDGHLFVNGGKVANFDYLDPVTLAAWIYPTAPNGAIFSSVKDEPKGQGYGLYLRDGKIRYHFTQRWTDLGMRLETERPIELNRWHHVAFTYDGKMKASAARIYVDGEAQPTKILFDSMVTNVTYKAPFRIGAGEGPEDRFQGLVQDVRLYARALTAEEVSTLPVLETVSQIAAISAHKRTPAQALKLAYCFLDQFAPKNVQQARQALTDVRKQRDEFYASIPTVMVMKEGPHRDAFILKRGAYDAHGDKVSPGLPHVLPPLPSGYPDNRLGFARWLVDRSNPLTARVTVNRFWQMLFGVGLVKTVGDFGSQGEWPVYADVLDWLAVEFMESGWNVKAILKTIVMSATYRQSSRVTPALLEKDPENRLLARGPRLRLSAEVIRDQALAVSGLLVEKIGGPPVKPYQPPGLWEEVSFGSSYKPDEGEALYRRSLYTYWKRTVAPPAMVTFDAADRETCVVRVSKTNTPLQALDLMNDVTYLEASRKLAERMMTEGGPDPADRIQYAFRLATSRPARQREVKLLLGVLGNFEQKYHAQPDAALHFVSTGKSPRNETLNSAELAAYTGVASVILNLDETITKQ
jgi:Protein of unknown function (DUF1553)/Protein of unknown function (DUF1549)/Concanavalin A-like lectin/glucanases superfamily/Planctomycete cytochrome C